MHIKTYSFFLNWHGFHKNICKVQQKVHFETEKLLYFNWTEFKVKQGMKSLKPIIVKFSADFQLKGRVKPAQIRYNRTGDMGTVSTKHVIC